MDMFKMMKQAKDMYAKVKETQKALEAQKVEINENGIKIVANGKQEILSVELSDELMSQSKDKIEKYLLKALQETNKRTQKIMEQESKKITGGMGMSDMMNMLK